MKKIVLEEISTEKEKPTTLYEHQSVSGVATGALSSFTRRVHCVIDVYREEEKLYYRIEYRWGDGKEWCPAEIEEVQRLVDAMKKIWD